MRRACLILMLVALFAGASFAGHALNSPMATTNPGDFWCSGDMDVDGTAVFDGVCTFNANAIFTLDVSVGQGFSVTGDIAFSDSLYVAGNAALGGDVVITGTLTVLDTLIISGDVRGDCIGIAFMSDAENITADAYLSFGSMLCAADRGATMPRDGDVHAYGIRVQIDTAGGSDSHIEFDINGVLAFSDTLLANMDTGWYTNEGEFGHGDIPFNAGDFLTVEWNETGAWQIDVPQMTMVVHPSD